MPTYQFEALDRTGQEIRDVLEAASEEEAQVTIQKMGYFITKISVKKAKKAAAKKGGDGRKRAFAIGGVKSKQLTTFTRQLSILQDAGLPILRSLKILEQQQKPGRLKNSLMDTCDEIEAGSTLSEAMAKSPKAFDRLYVNMIKAGEAGGALETILKRLAEFQERSLSLKRKIKGALIYPIVVVLVAVLILTFIMIFIVPKFIEIFDDFGVELPTMTVLLVKISYACVHYWWAIPGIPISICADGQTDSQVQGRPHGLGLVHHENADLRTRWSKKAFSPAPPAPWAPWSPAACRSSKVSTSPAKRPATPCSSSCSPRSASKSARASRSPSR